MAPLAAEVAQAATSDLLRATRPVAGQYIVVLRADALAARGERVPQVSSELVRVLESES